AAARADIDRIVEDLRHPDSRGSDPVAGGSRPSGSDPEIGDRVSVGGLGLDGVLISIDGNRAEVDVRGKRIQAKVKELRVISSGGGQTPKIRVNVDLKPREGMLSELNVIGMKVEEAVDRIAR